MPPKTKLPLGEVQTLTRWVEAGARWPNSKPGTSSEPPPSRASAAEPEPVKVGELTETTEEERPHWAFQPLVDPELPEVKDASWPQSPIDHFVLARLEAKACTPPRRSPSERCFAEPRSTCTACRPRRTRCKRFSPMIHPARSRRWSIDCWARRATASAGDATGSMSPATPTATVWTTTLFTPTPGVIAMPGIHFTQVTPTSCSWAHSVLASQSATIERYGVGSTAMACCTRR